MSMTAEGINPCSSVQSVSDLSDWILHLVRDRMKLKAKEVRIDDESAGAVQVWIIFDGFYVSNKYSVKYLRQAQRDPKTRRALRFDIRRGYFSGKARMQLSKTKG